MLEEDSKFRAGPGIMRPGAVQKNEAFYLLKKKKNH
jgi:hypothetical protein